MKYLFKLWGIIVFSFIIIGCTIGFDFEKPIIESATSPQFNPKNVQNIALFVQIEDENFRHQIENKFIVGLLPKGYQTLVRADVNQLLEELHFQHSGLTDSQAQDIAKFGKMANVQAILLVTPTSAITMGARLINVERADTVWITTATSYKTIYNTTVWEFLAGEIVKSFPAKQ